MKQRLLVWDLPTRIFHWSLAASFATAWLTAEAEQWHQVHLTSGYLFAALILFRLVWGVVGSRHARFASFIRSPATTLAYLRSYVSGKPQHYVGHNPLGAVAVVLMLTMGIGIAVSGWLTFNEVGGEAFEEVHEVLGNGMLLVVLVHIVGVIVSSRLHRENLVGAMITGHKAVAEEAASDNADSGIRKQHGIIALLLVAALGTFGWALTQGKLPALWDPNNVHAEHGGDHGEKQGEAGEHEEKDDDDD